MRTKPHKNQKIYNDNKLLGVVHHIDGNICYFTNDKNDSDCFIWKFEKNAFEPEKLNELTTWK